MAFSQARQHSQVKLSAKEMFEISQEISREFSPIISSIMPGLVPPDILRGKVAPETGRKLGRKRVFSRPASSPQIKLSRQELIEISREISRQFGPRFVSVIPELDSRIKLSAQEILAVSEEISREFAPKSTGVKPELVLLPVDPQHLHAYWKVDENEIREEKQPEPPLTLRIYPEPSEYPTAPEAEVWFDVTIASSQGQQKIDLPASISETRYSAAIGKSLSGQGFTAYVHSNIIYVPRAGDGRYPGMENKNASGGLPFSRKHASGQGK